MKIYKEKWKGKEITLLPRIWPLTLVNTQEASAILNCSPRTLERYRVAAIGPTPEPLDLYVGTARFYALWRLIAWRSHITGSGPLNLDQVWEWFIEQPEAALQPRENPPKRPDWWPRGERLEVAKSRKMWGIKLRIAELEYKAYMIGMKAEHKLISRS
ncbi:MAG: hypothetical protein COA81_13505 [Alphaproteobacteria bacterium]|nr:MAG: hypothetical protein COA81_13505 [Alphaproteobacteria bacterium]